MSIQRELEADVKELAKIDGKPRPPKLDFTADGAVTTAPGTYVISGGGGGGGYGSVLTSSGTSASFTVPKVTLTIPAGTRLRLDTTTGEYVTVDDIKTEI